MRRDKSLSSTTPIASWPARKRTELIGSRFQFTVIEQGESAIESNGTKIHDQKIETTLGPRWIGWREALVRFDAGAPAELQCVGRDVTDRTETERALAEARDLADAANRAKSRFSRWRAMRSARRSTASSA